MSDAFATHTAALEAAQSAAADTATRLISGKLAELQKRFPRHAFEFVQGMGVHFVTVSPAVAGERNLHGDDFERRGGRLSTSRAIAELSASVAEICGIADKLETEFRYQVGNLEPGAVPEQPEPAVAIAAAVAALGLTVRAEFVPFSKSRNAMPGAAASKMSLNWLVTLERNGRPVLTTDYSAGIGHCPSYRAKVHGSPNVMTINRDNAIRAECETGKAHDFDGALCFGHRSKAIEPKAHDVLYSLVMDSGVLDFARFEDWAAEYGYEPDSRSAEKTYRACLETALALRAAIGDVGLESLRVAFQDY